MSIKITWHGHNCWLLETGGQRVWIDPFLTDNPQARVAAADVEADFLLVSHGHSDHVGDAAPIARRTGARVVASYEVGQWLMGQGVDPSQVTQMNLGGTAALPFGAVKMTLAHHSSSLPDGSYGGSPCGLLLTADQKRLYFACDTALFLDMKVLGGVGLDLAVLPIGDLYTMGPDDAVEAVRLLSPKRTAPCHYNTWPPIQQDADRWATQVRQHTSADPIVPRVGEPFVL